MPAKDAFHEIVRTALEQEGWTITHDPYYIDLGFVDFYIDIIDGKIWVQHDGTEDAIADRLVAKGVPKQDIVLAYHAPHVRQYTEFAVG